MKVLIGFACVLCAFAQESARLVDSPPRTGVNGHYTGNRAPLLANPLIKLPIGAVKPAGYLRHQLELTAAGFSGHLSEISEFCKMEGNAWTTPDGSGHWGWEEVPYWLRGYYNTGYLTGDKRILAEANMWLDRVLASQQANGYFGSRSNMLGERTRGVPDLWPNMVMLFPLRSRYEATGDKRILDFMKKYFRYQMSLPLDKYLPASWQHWRAGDNLDSIYWLYNQTGESWLLDLARVNHERAANWISDIPTWHVVNIAECFREPAQYYQQTKDVRYLRASERVWDTIRGLYGQVPGGMYGADENARPGFTGPRQATETCAFVEFMFSGEMLTSITGDSKWADRVEEVAFNSFPASMTADLKGLHYLTAPNQVRLDRADKSPMIQNGGDMFSYNPYQYRCCQHNVAFGWPYFAEHLWMATRGNGIAAVLYAPSEVTAKVAGGTAVRITETTGYPFDEVVHLAISTPQPVHFPLTLRIPGWCEKPAISINGNAVALHGSGKGWAVVERTWAEGDKLTIRLPATISVTQWTKNRNTVSVNRGPLTYSLRIGERWVNQGGTEKWPGREVYATTPWNYALVLDKANPAGSFELVKKRVPLALQPFALETAPLLLRAKGRRIPQWKEERNGMVGEVQMSPVRTSQPEERIDLIPMGCARLRISAFPVFGDGPEAHTWSERQPPILLASNASHYNPPTVVIDGVTPRNSADRNTPRFSWPVERQSATEWLEIQWSEPRRIARTEVYWADDGSEQRSGVRLPAAWKVVWWDGAAWRDVSGSSGYESRVDGFSVVSFSPVETTRLRLEVKTAAGGVGIYEWRIPD
ncbi:MAG: glycoside hydrolase family 127 protein [Bryobacteraceae bacterium]|nr:glycoside hydrolase family 127 protein [Bryobacterales bacterium]MEB2363923.1 glycoside hydrolase family 127 protein [Bryobacterales bacterium]NUN00287.1 glycoside hydrolase family 127 protein [Bryobacteraceae bacterium]